METLYIAILVILLGLSITGLIVGVSNDAVNFLTSAFGSKVASLKVIFTVASAGVLIGSAFSTGMMEIPRNGIFHPELYYFDEVMIIFMAVILANILLLDFFNSLGLPTSTSVSIVFELLGAAACLAFIRIYNQGSGAQVLDFLNTSKVTEIVVGILLSVFIAFGLGAIIQYLSRLIFTFQYKRKIEYLGALFGGGSLAALSYFIVIEGLSSLSFVPASTIDYIQGHTFLVLGISFVFWTLVSQLIMSVFKRNILKVIILVGTFALALAFAGNDLVNFIGVPLAAMDAYDLWYEAFVQYGTLPSDFSMSGLNNPPPGTSFIYLLIAGVLMVLTLWFSKQARSVIETGVSLSRQGDGAEKYEPNNLSRYIVRYTIVLINAVGLLFPKKVRLKIEKKFENTESIYNDKRADAPAFDMIRASVNLVVAAILISVGTGLKLPLSTTYVTFMVAMGSSLSDRAWDRESAVYRVSGVLNVMAGWIATAFIAFAGAAIFAAVLWFGGLAALIISSALAVAMVVRSAIKHSKKRKEEEQNKRFNKQDIISISEITFETADNISKVIKGIKKRYGKAVDHLAYYDLAKLKKDTKKAEDLQQRVEDLKDDVFYLVKSVEDSSVQASQFYILLLDYLDNMVEAIDKITRSAYKHVNNNHKQLKFNQIRDLKQLGSEMRFLFEDIIETFDNQSFENIDRIITDKSFLLDDVSSLIQKQIMRIRSTESSKKNSKLYFRLLLETKDIVTSTMDLLHLFQDYYSEAQKEL